MAVQTNARAKTIANVLKTNPLVAAIDWMTIIQIIVALAPILIKCFIPADGREAKAYVGKRFLNNRFDKRLRKAVTRQTLVAGIQQKTKLTYAQAEAIGQAVLDDILNGDESQLSLVIHENLA